MRPQARPLFASSGPALKPLAKRLGKVEVMPPRDGAWLMGAAAPSPESSWPEEEEKESAEKRVAAEIEKLRNTQANLDSVLERYLDGIAHLERFVRELPAEQAKETVELACVIARAIVGRELELDPERTAALVKETLQLLESCRDVTVRLNEGDLSYLREHHPELLETAAVSFVADDRLETGGCMVETPKRIIDASIEARMREVRTRLDQLLAQPAESP
ncbi:MAG: FliH/SctL family protein [Pseudomonadota bacterium]